MVENIENAYVPEIADIVWLLSTLQKENKQEISYPTLVLSPKLYNEKSGLCLCVPFTSKIKGYPFEVRCEILDKDSAILSDQLESVDYKARKATFIAKCDESVFHQVKAKIALLFELNY